MANEKIFQSRIQLKHDIEENWSKATNFIPKVGEIIIYDIDENNSIARFKIGDGITNINSLPFVSHHEVISYLPQELTEEQKKQARDNIGSGDPQIQTDWNQNDETAVDFIKNRTHYTETGTGVFEREIKTVFAHGNDSQTLEFEAIPMFVGQVLELHYIRINTDGEYNLYGTFTVTDNDGDLVAYDDANGSPMYITANSIYLHGSFGYNARITKVKIVGETTTEVVHRLDEKYIPDTIMRTPSEDDALELVAELGLAEPMTDDEGNVLTDENGVLFLL